MTLCLAVLLLALALSLPGDLPAALVPDLPAVALLESAGPAPASPAPVLRTGSASAPGARGPPSAG